MIWKAIRYLLYTNIFIGLCAASLVAITQIWYGGIGLDIYYTGFVFFGTIVQYGLHRIIGLRKINKTDILYSIVKNLEHEIVITTGISSLGTLICLSQLDIVVLKSLIIPVVLSLLYVLPMLKGGKRMRDLPFIKIFIISLTWTWITFYIPAMSRVEFSYLDQGLLVERFFFIFAITLPFDIRDIKVDGKNGCKTIATSFGEKFTKVIAQIALFAGFLSLVSICLENNPFIPYAVALLPGYILAYVLVIFSNSSRSDEYFILGLDGTMTVHLIATLFLTYFIL